MIMNVPLTYPLPRVAGERDSRINAAFLLSLSPYKGERLGEGVSYA